MGNFLLMKKKEGEEKKVVIRRDVLSERLSSASYWAERRDEGRRMLPELARVCRPREDL